MKTRNTIIGNLAMLIILLAGCMKEDVNNAIGTPFDEASLFVIRNVYKGAPLKLSTENLSGAQYTAGVVISDNVNHNFPKGYIAIENLWRGQIRGILVQVPDETQYAFGDSIRIHVDGALLDRQDGMLVLKNIPSAQITKVPGVKIIKKHRAVSISTIEKAPELFEATLISITADINPDPVPNESFKGGKLLLDGENKSMELFTEDAANFATEKIAPSASFQGVLLKRNDKLSLRMQSASDMKFPSGKLYSGWPETFEEPYQTKTSYNIAATNNLVTTPLGEWYMLQCIQGNTVGRDRIVSGKQAIRFQQNLKTPAYLQMNFDVPDGASKVTLWYGAYYTDRACTFDLEYSTNQGATWVKTGPSITDAHSTAESLVAKQAVFLMDIKGPVRFRINKLGLGTSDNKINNGRLGMDDIAIFKSY